MTKDEEALGSGFIFSGIISKFCECVLCEHNNESKNSKKKNQWFKANGPFSMFYLKQEN